MKEDYLTLLWLISVVVNPSVYVIIELDHKLK